MNKVAVFAPDLGKLVKMTVTKDDILAIFEEKIHTELKEKKAKADADLNEQRKIVTIADEAINTLTKTEEARIIKEYAKKIPSKKPLKYMVRFDINKDDVKIALIGSDAKGEIRTSEIMHMAMMGPLVGIYCGGSERSRNTNMVCLEIEPSPQFLTDLKNLQATMSKEATKREALNKIVYDLDDDIRKLPYMVKKFSIELTKKALNECEEGKNILQVVEQLTKQMTQTKFMITEEKSCACKGDACDCTGSEKPSTPKPKRKKASKKS